MPTVEEDALSKDLSNGAYTDEILLPIRDWLSKQSNRGSMRFEEAVLVLATAELGLRMSPNLLEIGTYLGRTSRLLSDYLSMRDIERGIALQKGEKTCPRFPLGIIVTIDPEIRTRVPIQNERENILRLRGSSRLVSELVHGTFGFAFIDGCHCKACVTHDIEAWGPRVVPNGFIVLHDTWSGFIDLPQKKPILHAGQLLMGVPMGVHTAITENLWLREKTHLFFRSKNMQIYRRF